MTVFVTLGNSIYYFSISKLILKFPNQKGLDFSFKSVLLAIKKLNRVPFFVGLGFGSIFAGEKWVLNFSFSGKCS